MHIVNCLWGSQDQYNHKIVPQLTPPSADQQRILFAVYLEVFVAWLYYSRYHILARLAEWLSHYAE